MGKGGGLGWGSGMDTRRDKGKMERFWIPAFPLPIAIVCCVFNFLIPGFGTFIAGFASLCCARTEDMGNSSKALSCCVNMGVAFGQLLAALCCFLGICWSWYWGVTFLITSNEYYHSNKVTDNENIHGGTTAIVIVEQPSHVPFKTLQSGTYPPSNITTQQPTGAPLYPPAPGTSSTYQTGPPGMELYPPTVVNADGSEQKIQY